MNLKNKAHLFYAVAMSCAIWFVLTAWIWTFFINLFVALPFGIAALLMWHFGKNIEPENTRFRYVLYVLATGVAISLIALVVLLLNN